MAQDRRQQMNAFDTKLLVMVVAKDVDKRQ
jgi:hypothetical protein